MLAASKRAWSRTALGLRESGADKLSGRQTYGETGFLQEKLLGCVLRDKKF